MAVLAYGYGTEPYGQVRYGGDHPFTIVASVDQRGIPFIVGNDRYQIVCCDDPGTTASAPSFRYWYAGPPLWDEILAVDPALPPFFALDEENEPVHATLELPFRPIQHRSRAQSWQYSANELVDGVLVDFTPMPASIESITATVGFTLHVEGYGLQDYSRDTGGTVTGITVTESFTFAESQSDQASEPWPNIRTAWCPLRSGIRCASARVVFTDITLCEIEKVRLMGSASTSRTQ